MSPGQQLWILEHLRELTGDDPLVMAEAAGMSTPTLAAYYRRNRFRARQRRRGCSDRAMSSGETRLSARADDHLATLHQSLIGEALEHSSMLVFVADEAMRYVAVSSRACEVLGFTRDELLKLSVLDVAFEATARAEYEEMIAAGSRAEPPGSEQRRAERSSSCISRPRHGLADSPSMCPVASWPRSVTPRPRR